MATGDAPYEGVYLTAGEVARILEVSPKTVSRWADKGLLPCVVTLGRHRRFRQGEVERIHREMDGRPSEREQDEPTE